MKKIFNKFINLIKNNKVYVLSFVIGLMIIGTLYKLNNVSPFGDRSLLTIDFYHQYGPMLAELYDRIHNLSSFTYSFTMGMGLPFFRNFLNYLSSPFNLLMLFFPRSGVVTSYSFIIGIKAAAACTTMVYYLSKKFNKKELYLIPLGILYAFSAYYSAYYWNIMWLDGMVMTPLITYGIEKIVNKKEWKFYSLSLALLLFANYFIGYMLCIYSVVYFIIYILYKSKLTLKTWKQDLKDFGFKCFLFAFASFIGGMLTFGLLIPMAYSITSISATGGEMPITQYYDFKLIDFLKGHLSGVTTTTFASDNITNPNISCGILSVALLLAYLINLEIPLKNKVAYISLLGFFIAAFFIPQLDFILHAFHVPNDLPYRYSFLYSFVLIVICAYSLINIKKIKFPLLAISYVFLMAVLFTITKDAWPDLTTNMIYINMILLTLYFLFYSGLYFLDIMHTLFYMALIVVACIDVVVSINSNWNITQDINLFYSDYNDTENLLSYIKNQDKDLFYRIENTNMMTLNDGSWYNYNGMTTFSSMAYENMAILQHNLGMPGNEINSYYYVQQTPIYDLMFDMKYFIGESNDYVRYHKIYEGEESAIQFDYNVGLGFGADKSLLYWNTTSSNPFQIQNEFVSRATNQPNPLEEAKLYKAEEIFKDNNISIMKYEFDNVQDNYYFYTNDYSIDFFIIGDVLYYKNDSYSSTLEKVNFLEYTMLDDYTENNIVNINSSEDKITIYVGYTNYYLKGFNLYSINQEKFENIYRILKDESLTITEYKEDEIKGRITLNKNKLVYTSIPYDEGWHVYVDGKEVETYAVGDALLSFFAKEGTHKIRFVYRAPYMFEGTLFSIVAAVILIIDTWFKDKLFSKKVKREKLVKKEKKLKTNKKKENTK